MTSADAPLHRHPARIARVSSESDLDGVWTALGLKRPNPVLVLVGGASGMSDDQIGQTRTLFENGLADFVVRRGITIVDGGTDDGVMQAAGIARETRGGAFPLVGVVIEQLIGGSSTEAAPGAALEPHHSHFIITPGADWDASARWISLAASSLSQGLPSLTLLFNGGKVAWADAEESVQAGRPVVVAAGSGRTADEIARTKTGEVSNKRAASLLRSGLISVVDPFSQPGRLVEMLERQFGARPPGG